MTVVAQLGIGARAKMQMAATGDRGFRLAAMLPRCRVLKLQATWYSKPVGERGSLSYGPFNAPLTIKPPGRR
jgi:hypothetical protein